MGIHDNVYKELGEIKGHVAGHAKWLENIDNSIGKMRESVQQINTMLTTKVAEHDEAIKTLKKRDGMLGIAGIVSAIGFTIWKLWKD